MPLWSYVMTMLEKLMQELEDGYSVEISHAVASKLQDYMDENDYDPYEYQYDVDGDLISLWKV